MRGTNHIIYYGKNGYLVKNVYSKTNKHTEYVIYNKNRSFELYHTHVNNFNMCKMLINCAVKLDFELYDVINNSVYLLESLKRIVKDKNFKLKIEKRINKLNNK